MRLIYLIFALIFSNSTFAADKSSANRLLHESSPYLLQHAYNPVDWYPWSDEAFERARKEDKPIFISIGYSTCHWCHVMAHESFENNEIANILNQHFISIKVDREERPDIDRIYLSASEIMNGYGGWPTTAITTTALKPFFANTYIPPYSKDNVKGLVEILNKVVVLWKDDRDNVERVANDVTALLKQSLQQAPSKGSISPLILKSTYNILKKSYDAEYGGFSNAPKFPRTPVYEFMLTYGKHNPNTDAHKMLFTTLDHLSRGGIYDHVGGGFHRYSVDAQWQVPHFEKMLYDQGLIINSLTEADKLSASNPYQHIVKQSLAFVLEHMREKEGGFYSAYDADSTRPDNPDEHGEGAYYVWHKKELDTLLNQQQQNIFYAYFNIQENGNVVSDPTQEFTNLNVLYADRALPEVARELQISPDQAEQLLQQALQTLKTKRLSRPIPHLDDKIITSWNALMIQALANAAQHYKNPAYLTAAEQAASFLLKQLYDANSKTLYRSYRQGKHSGEAYLDDYAYLVKSLITLHQITNNNEWLKQATMLNQLQISLFYDETHHGFFDNSATDKNVLIRSKEIYDGVLPSANAISIQNLRQLATLSKKPEWNKMAEASLQSFHQPLNEQPENYPQMLTNLLIKNNP